MIYNDQGYFLCESKDSPNDIFEKSMKYLLIIIIIMIILLIIIIMKMKFYVLNYIINSLYVDIDQDLFQLGV